MEIRLTTPEDLEIVLSIYESARQFMKQSGNPDQWRDHHPSRALIESDIARGLSYVCAEDSAILGVFYFAQEEDPTYRVIDRGAWLSDAPYGVVHRIAVAAGGRGVGALCLNWCFEQFGNLRIDTHKNNAPMRRLLEKCQFTRCGIIYLDNGDERVAYQKQRL